MLKGLATFLAIACVSLAGLSGARADACEGKDFDAAIDGAGASLRFYNASAMPKLQDRIRTLSQKKGRTGEAGEEETLQQLSDARVADFDMKANELLAKIDQLGRPKPDGSYDCAKLPEIETASVELLTVMKSKFAYLDEKLDRELGVAKAADAKAPVAAPPVAPAPKPAEKAAAPAAPVAEAKPAPPAVKPAPPAVPKVAPPSEQKSATWDTTTATAPVDAYRPEASPPDQGPPGEPYSLPPVELETTEAGYTIDEINAATTGFFGSISTGLGSVIEHAFSSAGRPTAYILGKEGGGAFLAGLRYGSGTIYFRQGGSQPIFWHGPSLGYDVGAEGGRTLILVYKLKDANSIYRRYTGVDGSAYLVGGVGMTLLKGGPVIMAPIRSGVGVRLGANIGYLRFTDQPTWNPF